MKYILALLLLFPLAANAMTVDLRISWEAVTTRKDGSPVMPEEITYTAYYAPLGRDSTWEELPQIPGIATTANYPDLVLPDGSSGIQVYMVATDYKGIPSSPSPISSVQFNVIDIPMPIDPTSPPSSITINLKAVITVGN